MEMTIFDKAMLDVKKTSNRVVHRIERMTFEEWMWIVFGVVVVGGGAWYAWKLWKRHQAETDNSADADDEGDMADESDPTTKPAATGAYNLPQYAPHSADANMLFLSALRFAQAHPNGIKDDQYPDEWATQPEWHNIMAKESQGWVGIPNYHFGNFWGGQSREQWPLIWASIRDGTWRKHLAEPFQSYVNKTRDPPKPDWLPSSATGLGQLTSTNIKTGLYYPSGLQGIGNALEEAIGQIRYIKKAYGSPQDAWASYGKGKEGY